MANNILGSIDLYGLWMLTFTTTDEREWAMVFTSEEEALKVIANDKDAILTWETRPIANTLHLKLDGRQSCSRVDS